MNLKDKQIIELKNKIDDYINKLRENEIIGTCLITLKNNPINNTKTFYLDYICIKEEYRNRGLGSKIIKEVERIARSENINYLELTSNRNREYARKMYFNEGMTIKDTDVFIKEL